MSNIRLLNGVECNYLYATNDDASEAEPTLPSSYDDEANFSSALPATCTPIIATDFEETVNGSPSDDRWSGVNEIIIIKQFDDMDTTYYMGRAVLRPFQDFAVGNTRHVTYSIYPVCTRDDGTEYTKGVMEVEADCDFGYMSLIGLTLQDDGSYGIDMDNIWNIAFNVSDPGLNITENKAFTDNMSRFPHAALSKRSYYTQSISGLLGRYDCSSGSIYESVGMMEDFRKFSINGELKLFRDMKGMIIPCEISDVSFSYSDETYLVSVNFTFTQLADFGDIIVNPRGTLTYSLSTRLLADANSTYLQDTESSYLAAISTRVKGVVT